MGGWRLSLVLVGLAAMTFTGSGWAEQPDSVEEHGAEVRQEDLLKSDIDQVRRELREGVPPRAHLVSGTGDDQTVQADAAGVPTKADQDLKPAGVQSTSLLKVLEAAAKNSPMVEAARHRWLATTYRRAQNVSLPDPKVEANYYVRRVDTKWMVRLSQEIPYPEKLILGGKVADKEAAAARLRYEASVRDALSDAKEIYFELYYVDRAQSITEQMGKLYERYAALAAGGTTPAAPKLPETFRAESQRAQLNYDLVLLREIRATEAERLRAAIGATKAFDIAATEDMADPAEMVAPLEELHEVASQRNQELQAAGIEVERSRLQAKLARRAPIPDLMIGGTYERMNMNDEKQIGVMAGISLPLWVPKYRAMAKEAGENEKAARAEQNAQGLKVRSDLARAYFSLNNSYRLVQLYRDTLIPQARQALNSAEELYRGQQTSLSAVLETTATVYNFELARLRATADFYQNIARIERVLGIPLSFGKADDSKAKAASPDMREEGEKQ